jgi:hypothetical protein
LPDFPRLDPLATALRSVGVRAVIFVAGGLRLFAEPLSLSYLKAPFVSLRRDAWLGGLGDDNSDCWDYGPHGFCSLVYLWFRNLLIWWNNEVVHQVSQLRNVGNKGLWRIWEVERFAQPAASP